MKGNRQVAKTLEGIREDHRLRYQFAGSQFVENDIESCIDVGCGVGYGSFIMALMGLKVKGYDMDPDPISYGEAHYPHEKICRSVSDLKDINVPMGYGLAMFEVIEHSKEAPEFLRRNSSPLLVGSVPNQNIVPFGKRSHPEHYRHYTPEEIKEELFDAGWDVKFVGSQIGKRGKDARITDAVNGRTLVFMASKE